MAKISKMIDDLTGKTEEEMRLKEQLVFLQKMASAKSETFENRLKRMLSTPEELGELEIVGDKAFGYRNGQHVNISQQCDDAIGGAIDEYFKGGPEVKACFQKIVKQRLSRLMGHTSLGETEEKMYFVFPESSSIVRVDVMVYKYTFSSKGVFVKDVENVFVYTMAKSIVDEKKVGIDILMSTVEDMLRGNSDEDLSLEEIMPFVKSLQEAWTTPY